MCMQSKFTCITLLAAFLLTCQLKAASIEWTEVADAQSLAQAIETGTSGIRIIDDFETEYDQYIIIDHDLSLDLSGHKVTMRGSGFAFTGVSAGTICDLSEIGGGELITASRSSLLFINTAGSFTLLSGTISTTDKGSAIEVNKGVRNVQIQGGAVKGSRNGYAVINKGYVTMTGGTIIGCDDGIEPVQNIIDGEFTMSGGAVYAGNNATLRCFDNVYWTDGEDEEQGRTILPEGVVYGGAIVLDEQYMIPGTYYLNYHLPDNVQRQPNITHYYNIGTQVTMPSCAYKDNKPFAGWSVSEDDTESTFMFISAENGGRYKLYPVWKYTNIPDAVVTDLIPE